MVWLTSGTSGLLAAGCWPEELASAMGTDIHTRGSTIVAAKTLMTTLQAQHGVRCDGDSNEAVRPASSLGAQGDQSAHRLQRGGPGGAVMLRDEHRVARQQLRRVALDARHALRAPAQLQSAAQYITTPSSTL